ncbi:hypothetical protein Y032_0332g2756 [Ancylostoma ceylanicum]|uniref:Uncharacterized protein n=1 Tax=Ancylostoma ceylanicum TaxID=53326 RepID=A0A016RZC6_9BILA|nr:hypothetical protein Y032_0332g2756 [Ancylostoma ceylanicum]
MFRWSSSSYHGSRRVSQNNWRIVYHSSLSSNLEDGSNAVIKVRWRPKVGRRLETGKASSMHEVCLLAPGTEENIMQRVYQ